MTCTLATACEGVTVVSRPRPDGAYLVCAIRVVTGLPVGVGIVCPHGEVSLAAIEIGRDLDKFYGSGGRHRVVVKPHRMYTPVSGEVT